MVLHLPPYNPQLNGLERFLALQAIRRDSLAFLAADLMRVVLVRSNFLR